MKREEILTKVKTMIFSGKDPLEISEDITDYIEKLFSGKGGVSVVLKSDAEALVDKWLELYPKGVRSGGKLLRSDKRSCVEKMSKFLRDYPEFTEEEILEATRRYLDECSQRDYDKTICATYFIHRQGVGSELAARCAELETLKEINSERKISVNKGEVEEFFI